MIKGIKIVHVVAQATNRIIGSGNTIPWQVPADMRRFRKITEHGIIVMGHRTFDSLPSMLKNRCHVVIGRSQVTVPQVFPVGSELHCFSDLQEGIDYAVERALFTGDTEVFIIGGGEIYAQTLDIADEIELTVVRKEIVGDTVYPALSDNWFIEQLETHEPDGLTLGYGFYKATRVRL